MFGQTGPAADAAQKASMKILVIEDDREASDYLEKAFAEAGHTAHIAGDGETGYTLAHTGDYDVLVIDRMLPYWFSDITASLGEGKTVLVTAHGNSLRALVKHLDGISDADIAELNIPTGIPLVYKLDAEFAPLGAGEYLDPEAAAAGAAAVAAQGAK